jgi:hypothetical protein
VHGLSDVYRSLRSYIALPRFGLALLIAYRRELVVTLARIEKIAKAIGVRAAAVHSPSRGM